MIAALLSKLTGVPVDHTPSGKRSPLWPATRAAFLREYPKCAACGGTKMLAVHHRLPFHLAPEQQLDVMNLIVLCEDPKRLCHWHFGHNSLSWSCYNPNVGQDAAWFLKRRAEARYA